MLGRALTGAVGKRENQGDKAKMKCTSIFAALLLLSLNGYASAQGCTIPTDDEVQARTAKCLLSIDGKLLVNERCNLNVSPDEPRHHH
jgi:hypothetical protein